MAFTDFISTLTEKFQQLPFGGRGRADGEPNLPNGGTSGYHPVSTRNNRRGGQPQAAQNRAGQTGGQPGMPPQQGPRQATGAVQPQGMRQGWGSQSQTQGWGAQGQMPQGQMQGWAPQQPAQGQTMGQVPQGWMPRQQFQGGFQSGVQGGYQNPPRPMMAPQGQQTTSSGPVAGMRQGTGPQTGSGPVFQQNQTGRGPQWTQQQQTPYQPKFPVQGERNRRVGREMPAPQEVPLDNVSYMPGVVRDEQGIGRKHTERLTQPMSASTCYRLIEFMRNHESVIVNTELIVDERERQRCLDILFGAAYALNCSFTRIAAKSIYLIAPTTVSVVAYESIRQMNEQDMAMNWPRVETEQPAAFRNVRAAR